MTRKPIRRFLPLTYAPKIPGVRDGSITQSIRIDTDLRVDDFVAFHGWSGKPYHSPWSFRTPYCEIILAELINIHEDSIYFPGEKKSLNFDDPQLDLLALKDGIDPPTGRELIDGLHAMYGFGVLHGKVLRWDPAPIKDLMLSFAIMSAEPVDREKNCFVITPDPSQISPDGRIRMAEGDFDNVHPALNKPLFEKIRTIERDLKACSQEAES